MDKHIPITQDGFNKLKKELEDYKSSRPEAVVNLRTAREMGDLSENAAYHAARSRLSSIDYHIRRLAYQLSISHVVSSVSSGKVGIGSKVTLTSGGKTFVYLVVGGYESDPLLGKISIFSPIGKAIYDKKPGDSANVILPKGNAVYTIEKVE